MKTGEFLSGRNRLLEVRRLLVPDPHGDEVDDLAVQVLLHRLDQLVRDGAGSGGLGDAWRIARWSEIRGYDLLLVDPVHADIALGAYLGSDDVANVVRISLPLSRDEFGDELIGIIATQFGPGRCTAPPRP